MGEDVSRGATLRPYEQSWRDRIAAALMGQERASPERARTVEALLGSRGLGPTGPSIADATPAGLAFSADEYSRAQTFGEAAAAALGFIPAVKPAKSIAWGALSGAENLASRTASIYNPPVKAARDFALDYPKGAVADDAGRLLRTIDGDPITARYVVGRTQVGGSDVALPGEAYDEIAKAITGSPILAVPQSVLGRDVGGVSVNRFTGHPTLARVSQALSPSQFERVSAHEIGHVIDQAAGEIPSAGVVKEAQGVYNTLNNGMRDVGGMDARPAAKPFLPQHSGYSGADITRELMAEAVRAYGQDPNFLKTVAPRLAERIRSAVNTHPTISKVVQFNAMGAPVAASPFFTDEQK